MRLDRNSRIQARWWAIIFLTVTLGRSDVATQEESQKELDMLLRQHYRMRRLEETESEQQRRKGNLPHDKRPPVPTMEQALEMNPVILSINRLVSRRIIDRLEGTIESSFPDKGTTQENRIYVSITNVFGERIFVTINEARDIVNAHRKRIAVFDMAACRRGYADLGGNYAIRFCLDCPRMDKLFPAGFADGEGGESSPFHPAHSLFIVQSANKMEISHRLQTKTLDRLYRFKGLIVENVVTLEPIADPDYFLSGEFRDGEIVLQPYLTPEAIRSFDENAIPKLAGISNCETVLFRKR